jgi:hypothetical protein
MPESTTEDARVRFLRSELERVLTLIRLAEDHRASHRSVEAAEALERARQGIANARVFTRMLRLAPATEAELTLQLIDLDSAVDSALDRIPGPR